MTVFSFGNAIFSDDGTGVSVRGDAVYAPLVGVDPVRVEFELSSLAVVVAGVGAGRGLTAAAEEIEFRPRAPIPAIPPDSEDGACGDCGRSFTGLGER
jgi:hypothetical protein